jgi:hypothetical protein
MTYAGNVEDGADQKDCVGFWKKAIFSLPQI